MRVFTYIHEDYLERFHIVCIIFYCITFQEKKKAAGTLDRTPAAHTHAFRPKKSLRATTFSLDFGRGGIGIFGSRKSGSTCGECSPVDISWAVFRVGIQYPYSKKNARKTYYCTSTFSPLSFYIIAPSPAIDTHSQCDIIQESKMQTQSSRGLTSACIFRFLRREPCRQQ